MERKQSQDPGNPMVGYPLIEKLIETEKFDTVNKTVTAAYDTLERMQKQKSGGLKRQKMIRQALKAYDLTIDLLRELLKTKYEIIKNSKGMNQQKKIVQKK